MSISCPKCEKTSTHWDADAGQMHCIMCGEYFNLPGVKQIICNKVEERDMAVLDIERIKTLISENKTFPEIIKETGYNKFSVRSAMKRLGLKCTKDGRAGNRPSKRLSPEKIQKKNNYSGLIFRDEETDSGVAGVVAAIDSSIAHHQSMIEKLTQAKNILL